MSCYNSQFVFLNNVRSQEIVRGVPQESVLGPILFNIYVNDIVHVSDKFKFVLFADDTNILYLSRNYEFVIVENTVNDELYKVNQWLCTNRLPINSFPSNAMICR